MVSADDIAALHELDARIESLRASIRDSLADLARYQLARESINAEIVRSLESKK